MTGPALLCAGVLLATGERIGRGGEGEVYAITGDPERAIKLYLKPDAAHEEKVRAMIAAQLADTCTSVTFPLQLVHRPDGSFAGFTMRRVSDSQPVFELFGSGSRRVRFPRADWAFLVRTAANVARVVAQVHARGVVIGDINSSGFLVSTRAIVTLIDADSVQVAGRRCRVGMPEYTPSELQAVRFDETDRTVDHDAFGLAVMIFQLLTLGRHPHAGVRAGRSIPLETAITQGRFAYSLIRKVGSTTPPGAVTLHDLSLGLRTLFERAFALRMGPRPTAAEWVSELALLEEGLARCLNNAAHIIPALAAPCPWCRIEKTLGQPLFPAAYSHGLTPQRVRTDLHHEVARVVQHAREHAGENVQPMWRRDDVSPSKAALKQLRQTGSVPNWPIATLQIRLGMANAHPARAFVDRHVTAQAAAAQALDRWRVELGVWEINTQAEQLRQNLAGLDRLRASRPVLLSQVTARVIAAEAIRRMRTILLDTAHVPGIGGGLRAHLVKHRVATAADVTPERLEAVPNLGDERCAALLIWRDRVMVEAQRSVASNHHALDTRITAEMDALMERIARADDALRAQCAGLELRVSKVRRRVWLLDRKVDDALHDRDEAAIDLELLGIDKKALAAFSAGATSPPSQNVVAAKAKKKSKPAKRKPVVCPACGAPVVKRWANAPQGSNKLFLGCSAYPRCTGSRPIHRKRAGP